MVLSFCHLAQEVDGDPWMMPEHRWRCPAASQPRKWMVIKYGTILLQEVDGNPWMIPEQRCSHTSASLIQEVDGDPG